MVASADESPVQHGAPDTIPLTALLGRVVDALVGGPADADGSEAVEVGAPDGKPGPEAEAPAVRNDVRSKPALKCLTDSLASAPDRLAEFIALVRAERRLSPLAADWLVAEALLSQRVLDRSKRASLQYLERPAGLTALACAVASTPQVLASNWSTEFRRERAEARGRMPVVALEECTGWEDLVRPTVDGNWLPDAHLPAAPARPHAAIIGQFAKLGGELARELHDREALAGLWQRKAASSDEVRRHPGRKVLARAFLLPDPASSKALAVAPAERALRLGAAQLLTKQFPVRAALKEVRRKLHDPPAITQPALRLLWSELVALAWYEDPEDGPWLPSLAVADLLDLLRVSGTTGARAMRESLCAEFERRCHAGQIGPLEWQALTDLGSGQEDLNEWVRTTRSTFQEAPPRSAFPGEFAKLFDLDSQSARIVATWLPTDPEVLAGAPDLLTLARTPLERLWLARGALRQRKPSTLRAVVTELGGALPPEEAAAMYALAVLLADAVSYDADLEALQCTAERCDRLASGLARRLAAARLEAPWLPEEVVDAFNDASAELHKQAVACGALRQRKRRRYAPAVASGTQPEALAAGIGATARSLAFDGTRTQEEMLRLRSSLVAGVLWELDHRGPAAVETILAESEYPPPAWSAFWEAGLSRLASPELARAAFSRLSERLLQDRWAMDAWTALLVQHAERLTTPIPLTPEAAAATVGALQQLFAEMSNPRTEQDDGGERIQKALLERVTRALAPALGLLRMPAEG